MSKTDFASKDLKDRVEALEELQYNVGDEITVGGGNSMYAGRIGWSGLEMYLTIPLNKAVNPNVSRFVYNGSYAGTVYACTSNSAIDITTLFNNATISTLKNEESNIILHIVFNAKPFSFNDGAVNMMFMKRLRFICQ